MKHVGRASLHIPIYSPLKLRLGVAIAKSAIDATATYHFWNNEQIITMPEKSGQSIIYQDVDTKLSVAANNFI